MRLYIVEDREYIIMVPIREKTITHSGQVSILANTVKSLTPSQTQASLLLELLNF